MQNVNKHTNEAIRGCKMTPIEIFLISFFGSFAGTLVAFIANYWLYKKERAYLEKMKKSIQNTVRKLKKK